MSIKTCEYCGKQYKALPHHAGRFCSKQCYWAKGGNVNRRGHKETRLNPLENPRDMDYWWAAGIYEGEGTCHGNLWQRKDGTTSVSPAVRVNQVDPWLPNRLRALFGGSLRLRLNNRTGGSDIIPSTGIAIGLSVAPRPFEIYEWNLNGERAREFLRRIYLALSPRRQGQVRKAFGLLAGTHP